MALWIFGIFTLLARYLKTIKRLYMYLTYMRDLCDDMPFEMFGIFT